MKYVFGVASPLVFAIVNHLIEIDKLTKDDCILLLMRGYKIPERYLAEYSNVITNLSDVVCEPSGRVFQGVRVWKTNHYVKAFDRLVDEYIGNDTFFWYSQVCNNDICSLMVTKQNCVGYYILEDGIGSYKPYNPQTFIGWRYWMYKWILLPLWPRIFAVKNHFIETEHPKFKACIGISSRAFPLHQASLRVIGVPFETIDIGYQPDAIISIDPLFLSLSDEQTVFIYQKLGEYVQTKQYKTIAYKYHPYFMSTLYQQHKKRYQQLIDMYIGTHAIAIDPTESLENILMTYRSDFYTGNSSIAIYAHEMGVTCYSYLHLLQRFSNDYSNLPLLEDICVFI